MQKRNNIAGLILLIALSISACQSGTAPATPTSVQSEKEAIIEQIHQTVEQYNAFLEKEKSTGNYTIVRLEDGSEGVQFTNESIGKVSAEMERVVGLIVELNEKYFKLSMQEHPPVAYPYSTIQSNEYGKLISEYKAWLENELKNGSTIIIITESGDKHPILIGDSYVAEKEWEQKLDIAEEKANQEYLNFINPEPDYQIIRRIEGADVRITFKEVSNSPYRTDTPYTDYETDTMRYMIDSRQRLVVSMSPIAEPQVATGLSVPELEKMARQMIALVSPEINLDSLTYSLGQKTITDSSGQKTNYFFRWEDLTKPVLDDGRSYPFVQVGLNGKGELLNYINTLPMAR
ncbi:MAG: hypothetical protein HZB19_20750 [Chloroflexi bacterium]|nr:hypothetical protein [Chloroflexota bacterium]